MTSRRTGVGSLARIGPAVLVLATVLGACAQFGAQGVAASATAPAKWRPAPCHRSPAPRVRATPVPGAAGDWTVISFDGTAIRAHWYPVPGASITRRYPTLLMGPGWGESGETRSTPGQALFGELSIDFLNRNGYNVLTWDPRGFGKSTGTIEVDSPRYEARDVSRLIDWVTTRPGVQLDGPGDPRVGMVGGSYGGGIQFVTASEDCRVDAIVPQIAWHSLGTSLDKADTPKTGWGNLLFAAAPRSHEDPVLVEAYDNENATGTITKAQKAWFLARGPNALVKRVRIPTLIVQGTVDTLFTLAEGVENYRVLREDGVPVHMLWYCGGHGVCLTNPGDPNAVQNATMAWLARWLKRDASVATGPRVDLVDQDGVRYAANDYPVPPAGSLNAHGNGTLALDAGGGSGPAVLPPGSSNPLATIAPAITPGRATNAVDVTIDAPSRPVLVVGAPRLTLRYRGTTSPGVRPTRVFAQLVDDTARVVVGNQVTPVDVTLDGRWHTTSVPLEIVCQAMRPGQHLTLQLVATTTAYARPRLGGRVDFGSVGISLPVARSLAVLSTSTPPSAGP